MLKTEIHELQRLARPFAMVRAVSDAVESGTGSKVPCNSMSASLRWVGAAAEASTLYRTLQSFIAAIVRVGDNTLTLHV